MMNEKLIRRLRKIARIWSGVVVAFGILVVFAEIAFPHTEEPVSYPWFENLIPIAMILGILGLAVAWKWEGIGGAMAIVFAVTNLVLYIFTGRTKVGVVALINSPIVIPALLYLLCWRGSKSIPEP